MPPDPPPIPIAARWLLFPVQFQVSFDRLITVGVLDNINWTVRTGNLLRDFGTATAVANHVRLTFPGIPGWVPGPDQVTYAPPPFDVLSDVGTPAAAFVFPY